MASLIIVDFALKNNKYHVRSQQYIIIFDQIGTIPEISLSNFIFEFSNAHLPAYNHHLGSKVTTSFALEHHLASTDMDVERLVGAQEAQQCASREQDEMTIVPEVAKVKFVLIAPPGWKFQFSPRFVKLFIKAVALLASMRVHDVTQLKTHRRMIMMIYMTSHFPWNRLLTREATCGRVLGTQSVRTM